MSRIASSLIALALFATPVAARAQSASPVPSPTAAPTADPEQVRQLAINIFHQVQNGHIQRSLFTDGANASLSDETVRELQQELASIGDPIPWLLNAKSIDGGITVYTFLLRTDTAGNLDEMIALDSSGKVAGINFSSDHSH